MKKFLVGFSLLLCVKIILSIQLNLTIWKEGFDNLKWNKRFISYVIRRVMDTSLYNCVTECLIITRCRSINYAKKFPVCELNYETEETQFQEFKDEIGFVYGNMKHFDLEIADSACTDTSCPINAKCQQTYPSEITCEVSDCGIPEVIIGATMMGIEQGIGIGHHRLYKCGNVEAISVCQNDGQWTRVNITCSLADKCIGEGNGYIYDSGTDMCVKLYENHLLYDEARSTCMKEGADLIILDTEEKHNYIGNNFCDMDKRVWIGLSDRDHEGEFKWVDNSTKGTNPTWVRYNNRATNATEADCVTFVCGRRLWRDSDCYSDKFYFCEKRMNA